MTLKNSSSLNLPFFQKFFSLGKENRVSPYLHLLIIGCLIISRRSDAIFHPQFWAEDGHVFYHDAYTYGVRSLIWPLGGYLNSFSRFVAFFTCWWPLSWAPLIFAVAAFAAQIIPPALLLSRRMELEQPSAIGRLAISYFYAINPNTAEININLTDAQWHLAIASFLIVVLPENKNTKIRFFEVIILMISGLSGPFMIFLMPLAVFEYFVRRSLQSRTNLAIVFFESLIQVAFIVSSSPTTRGGIPLGISLKRFCEITINQIALGGLLGDKITVIVNYELQRYIVLIAFLGTSMFLAIMCLALIKGSALFRKTAFFSACMFAAALKAPLLGGGTADRWSVMTYPGNGMRYYIMPVMVWFAAILICLEINSRLLRGLCVGLLVATFIGAYFEWQYFPYEETHFTQLAEKFDNLPAGEQMLFPENPFFKPDTNHWMMVLVKKN